MMDPRIRNILRLSEDGRKIGGTGLKSTTLIGEKN